MDIRTLVLINFILQILLLGTVLAAAYLAKVKRNLTRHCNVMRVAVIVLIISIVVVMAPSLFDQLRVGPPFSWFYVEMAVHAALGLVIIGIWVYANLCLKGIIRLRGRLLLSMRIAFFAWIAAFILGVHMYILTWV
ncbi:MAG: hypothetical protein HYX79_00075 [Chloroflexi bacterium]|nr:hypothetical protein [Chloroflexota bacterium]